MDLDWSFLTSFGLMLFIAVGYYWKKHHGIPDGPRGLPFLGFAPFFGPNPQDTFLALKQKYGKLFSMYMGRQLTIVLNDYEAIKAAYVGQADIFTGRAKGFVFEFITRGEDGETHGLGMLEGERWKNTRRFMLSTFRDLGMGKARIQDRILLEAECLNETIAQSNGEPYDPFSALSAAVANVICTLCWGRRYDASDKVFQQILVNNGVVAEYLAQAGPLLSYPVLRFVPGKLKQGWERFVEVIRSTKAFQKAIIEEHKKEYQGDEPRDYIDAFFKQQRKVGTEEENRIFRDIELETNIRGFFGAGTETTTVTLYWAMLYMAHYSDIQKKIQREIDGALDAGRSVTVEDRANLPYMEAVCREIQRCANVTPFGVLRANTEETTLMGYRIPKRCFIMPNFLAVNRDPKLWEEPNEFRPERFLDKSGKLFEPPYFMPFSIGKRACVGESLARMEIFLMFANVLQRFDIYPDASFPLPSVDSYTTSISCRPLPYKVRFCPRNQ
ncbi:hypothetical protein RvY_15827 [Ramazzottius varieornatus]|uniref:Cytochrome P450 n=1 Tax=Ramazzottius varieornatus TaxID=947166 RepID=A0A1D1VXR2_RAMVA|nr:hypothetical protein RvY_15827 [Ramazzottius varieornatus]